MSALAAIFHRAQSERPVTSERLYAMLQVVAYRGLDGLSAHPGRGVGLGCANTTITPESLGEAQPLLSSRTGCVVVADARLDNRAQLCALLARGLPSPPSDAELILRAYERWGTAAPCHLLGDFAFALWDPASRRMLCARDTSGQRALYYRLDRASLVVASEIRQLAQDAWEPLRPDEDALREYLIPLHVFRNEKGSGRTFFRDVYELPAGHILVVTPEAHSLAPYWEFTPPRPLRYRHQRDYAEHFRSLFEQVVRDRLRTAYPLGVFLSGGLDSSSIACTIQRLLHAGEVALPGFTTFTTEFEGLPCDERPFIEEMRARYDFDARFVSCGAYGGRLQLEPHAWREAPNAGVDEARDTMFDAVRRAGVRAVLTGDIADAYMYGSRLVFDSLLRQGHLAAFIHHLRAYQRVSTDSLRKTVALYCAAPLLPRPLHTRVTSAYLRRHVSRLRPHLLPAWMPEPLRAELADRHIGLVLAEEAGRRFANDAHEAAYRLLYPPEVARHPAPWPVEIWRPFADRRLHEFLFAIPPEQLFQPHPRTDEFYAGSKRVLRDAMRGILPESIRTRTSKTVFTPIWEQEFQRQWPLYEAAFGPAATSRVARHGFVDPARFWQRLRQVRESVDGNDLLFLIRVVELETWLRSLDRPLTVDPFATFEHPSGRIALTEAG